MTVHRDELKVGDTDALGKRVVRIFSKEKGKYVIYETDDRCVGCDLVEEALDQEVNDCYMKIAELTTHHKELKRYNSNLAYALKVALDGDPETASNLLDGVYQGMVACLKRAATPAYQIGALTLALLPPIGLWIFYHQLTATETGLQLYYSGMFAGLSGFVSVYTSSPKLSIDYLDSYLGIMFRGALRIIVAILCGLCVFALVQADLIFAFLKNSTSPYGYIVAAIVSGFSERLIPDALARIERREDRSGRPVPVRGRAKVKQTAVSDKVLLPGELSVLPETGISKDKSR